ncbi:MAG: M20/M25/M40 family metallo-hydrolase, partial [Pseudomonadota bacterium]
MEFKEALARVNKEEDYLIDVLRRLIAVDTTIPPGENYGRLLDLVEPELRRFGFDTQRIYVPEEKYRQIPEPLQGERPNMVAVMRNGRPRASYYAHMDVVPIDEPWTMDPFAGVIKNGKLFGRGAVDMKGAIACFLGAAKVLYEMGLEPLFDLECLLCTDEEVGVYPGARYLAEEGYFSNHLVWGEFGTLEPVVIIGTAGALRVDLTAIGKSCHSGMNWMGVNSIEEMVPILQELMTLKKEVEKRLSRIPAFPMPGTPYDKMSPMFNLNVIRGGRKDNVVPGDCTLTINRRYIPDEVYEDVVSEIEAAVKR